MEPPPTWTSGAVTKRILAMADLRLALIALIVLGLAPAQSAAHQIEPTRVLLVGDSITRGQVGGDPEFPPYAVVLQELLGEKRFKLLNAGCGGSTVIDWTNPTPAPPAFCAFLGAFESKAVPLLPADIMTVMLGSNDSIGFGEFGCETPGRCPVNVETYHERLLLLMEKAKSHGVRRVILSGPPPWFHIRQDAWLRLEGYRIVTEEVCRADRKVLCTKNLLKLLGPEDFAERFNPHPNVAGHQKIAEAFEPVVRRASRQVLREKSAEIFVRRLIQLLQRLNQRRH